MTEENKSLVYRLGSPDSVAFVSNYCISPGGIDVNVFLGEELQGHLQSITFDSTLSRDNSGCLNAPLIGELLYVLYCDDKTQEKDLEIAFGGLVGRKFDLKLVAATANINELVLFNKKIQFIGYKSGLSIDDIVMEYTYKFKVID